MTRNDSDWIRDFYLLITGVDNGVYEVEYPNGSDGMTEGAFYDRLALNLGQGKTVARMLGIDWLYGALNGILFHFGDSL